jgi:hypothetical protein
MSSLAEQNKNRLRSSLRKVINNYDEDDDDYGEKKLKNKVLYY